MAGITIVGPSTVTGAEPVQTPFVYVKREFGTGWMYSQQQAQYTGHRFGSDWSFAPELEFVRATSASGRHDIGSCEFRRRYGTVKQPWETAFDTDVLPDDLTGWWVCVLFGEQLQPTRRRGTSSPAWLGIILNETRQPFGSDVGLAGRQVYTAYEPVMVLRKAIVSGSYWENSGAAEVLGWCPPMNDRDRHGTVVGNRNDTQIDGTYVFGGTSRWSNYDFAEYLLKRFVADGDWYLGGQADILREIYDTIDIGTSMSVEEILRRLIPLRLGLDFKAQWRNAGSTPGSTWNAGFEVNVFPLYGEEASFGSVALPKNVNTVSIAADEGPALQHVRVVRSHDHRFKKVAVLGGRVVVCCSLRFSDSSLEGKWSASREALYDAGTFNELDPPDAHDAKRALDKYRAVYRLFGAPDDWNHQAGKAAPYVGNDGQIDATQYANYQNMIRSTLSWLPLREGWDYVDGAETNENPGSRPGDLMPPQAWIYDDIWQRYFPVDEKGISVSAARSDWGLFLGCSPNHILAKNHFDSANGTETDPKYDYETLVITIAFESDRRLAMGYIAPDATTSDQWKVIEVPDAELWYLAADTVVEVAHDGTLATGGAESRVLRNDVARMELAMAGAIARYVSPRARAELHFRGLFPAQDLVGQILSVVESGSDTQMIQSPITAVEWSNEQEPRTVIRAGFVQ